MIKGEIKLHADFSILLRISGPPPRLTPAYWTYFTTTNVMIITSFVANALEVAIIQPLIK